MRPKSKFRYVNHDLWAVMERARKQVPILLSLSLYNLNLTARRLYERLMDYFAAMKRGEGQPRAFAA